MNILHVIYYIYSENKKVLLFLNKVDFAINTLLKEKSWKNLSFCLSFVNFLSRLEEHKNMRILTVGFNDEYVKELEKELDKYFICIVDNAKDMYDATNFTDFRHYELVIIVDEGVKFSLERYVNE